MDHTRLLLFDIDGTILSTDRKAWENPFKDAMEQALNEAGTPQAVDTAMYRPGGKTDTQIIYEIMDGNGFSEEEIGRLFPRIREKYLGLLRSTVEAHPDYVVLKPGIRKLLDQVSARSEFLVGLLTGNFEEGARIKLGAKDLNGYFAFGAFGEGARVRSDLPPRAVEKAKAFSSHAFKGKEIVIIGDTPNDIHCGRHLGVRVVAVATGPYPVEVLKAEGADFVLPNLADARQVLEAILAPLP